MDGKRIIELSKRARAETITELSKQARGEAEREKKEPESQKDSKNWKRTLAVEWLWFVLTLLVSWIVSNILEYYVPAGAEVIAIILFGLVYVARLTFWAVKEVGKE